MRMNSEHNTKATDHGMLSAIQALTADTRCAIYCFRTEFEHRRHVLVWKNDCAISGSNIDVIGLCLEDVCSYLGLPGVDIAAIATAFDQTQPTRLKCEMVQTDWVDVIPYGTTGYVCLRVPVRQEPDLEGMPLGGGPGLDATMALLVRALDALSAEVAILDQDGRIVAVNRAWREFARSNGYADESAGVGSNYLSICDSSEGISEAGLVGSGLRAVLAGQQSATYVEYPCDSPDESRWFQVRASGFEHGGRRYAVVSHESLTESKRAEQRHREQLDEMVHHWRLSSLGELASGIAHELNQPLGAISNYMHGCLRRLEAGTIDREQLIRTARECAELAEFSGGIIKRMRGFASRTSCQYCPISLNDAAHKAMQFFRASPEASKVRVKAEYAQDLPLVRADEVQIQQVLLNLLRNAGDSVIASGWRPGQVILRTYTDGDGDVCVSVIDNGKGIPEGAESRLFNPFFSTKSHGMGLGLSISKTIAEVHGGRLTARNAPGGGAVFEFRLPALKRPALPLLESSALPHSPPCQPQPQSQGGSL